ncbi:MAG: hypothetical protein LBQ78_06925 [Tannerellaceae bacterium]|nr:hypothetical protein [Tannerellaceae bacterium]
MDECFFKPRSMEVFDSLLLVCDPVDDHHYVVVDLNKREVVLTGGLKGGGPDDLMFGGCMDKIDHDLFQVIDVTNRKTLAFSLSDMLRTAEFVPVKRISYQDLHPEIKDVTMFMYLLTDTDNISLGLYDKGKYVRYTSHDLFEYWLDYPEKEKYRINPFHVHQGGIHINRSKGVFLYHSPFGYYYEMVAYGGERLNVVFADYLPHEFNEDTGAFSLDTPCGINTADFTSDEVFMLYSGRSMKDYPTNAYYCDKILVTDYEGVKKRVYHLGRDVSDIKIDEKTRRIYAIARNPETLELEIGYFNY